MGHLNFNKAFWGMFVVLALAARSGMAQEDEDINRAIEELLARSSEIIAQEKAPEGENSETVQMDDSPDSERRMDFLNYFLTGRSNDDVSSPNRQEVVVQQQPPIQLRPPIQIQQPNPNQIMFVRETSFPNPNGGLLSRLILARRAARLQRWANRLQLLPLLFGLRQLQVQPIQALPSQTQQQVQQQPQQRAVLLLHNRAGEINPNYNPADVMNRPPIFDDNDASKEKSSQKQNLGKYGANFDDSASDGQNVGLVQSYGNNGQQQSYNYKQSYNQPFQQSYSTGSDRQPSNSAGSGYGNIRLHNDQQQSVNTQGYYASQNNYQNPQPLLLKAHFPQSDSSDSSTQNGQQNGYRQHNAPVFITAGQDSTSQYQQGNQQLLLLNNFQQAQQQQSEVKKDLLPDRTVSSGISFGVSDLSSSGIAGGDGLSKTGGIIAIGGSPVSLQAQTSQKKVGGSQNSLQRISILPKPVLNVNGKLFFGAELGKNAGIVTR